MSTRSRIAFEHEDGSVISIYCHFDGYPDGVGRVLLAHYNTPERVLELMKLGDLSSLAPKLCPDEGRAHSWSDPASNVTVAYGRDRGERNVDARTDSQITLLLNWLRGSDPEFLYLMRNGAWSVAPVISRGDYVFAPLGRAA